MDSSIRDLFDVTYILESEGFTEDIKRGFLYCLLSGDRPLHEILSPQHLDQRHVMISQFAGMTANEFNYDQFEAARQALIRAIHEQLTAADRHFLLAFPSVRWKMLNLEKLKEHNPGKFRTHYENLKTVLEI